MSKYLERKIRLYFECFKKEIDVDDLELIKESEIVNGVLTFPRGMKPTFKKITSFFKNESTDKK